MFKGGTGFSSYRPKRQAARQVLAFGQHPTARLCIIFAAARNRLSLNRSKALERSLWRLIEKLIAPN